MSDYGQWVASSSSHVVLDGVPFKVADNFRVAPVVASAEDRLCLRSQSSCLKDEYVFDTEKEYIHWYTSLLSFRETEEEKRKVKAAAVATAAAAAAAVATVASSASSTAAVSANGTAADASICDGSVAAAPLSPSLLRTVAAGCNERDSHHGFVGDGNRPTPPFVPPKPKHAPPPPPPGLGRDLLLPKPAVPRKPLLNSSSAAVVAATAATSAAPSSQSSSSAAGTSASLRQLDLALFEREEDVFDKMQLRTLNDLEELKSVLLPTTHTTGLPAATAFGLSAGDADSRTDRTEVVGAAAAITTDRAGSRSDVDEDETRLLLNSAGFGLASASSSGSSGLRSVNSDSAETVANRSCGTAIRSDADAAGLVSSDVMSAVASSAGQVVVPECCSSGAAGTTSARHPVAFGAAAPATSMPGTTAAAAAAASAAAAAAGTTQSKSEVAVTDTGAWNQSVPQRKAPSVPPRRCHSTEDASAAPDVLASVALAAGQMRIVAATSNPTSAATDDVARPSRLAPPPPPPKPTSVAHGVKTKHPQLRHLPANHLQPLSAASRPFSYTAASDAGSAPRLLPISASQVNASTVKNIVWPDLLSSPEPSATDAASAAKHSGALAGGLSGDATLLPSACNGESKAGKPFPATLLNNKSKGGAIGNTSSDNAGSNDDDLNSKLVAMGFPPCQVEFALRQFGKDDKKVVEHLCILSEFVDKGYDWRVAQTAILSYPGHMGKVEEFLSAYQRLLEYGFEGDKIQQALMTHDGNADKALDTLAGAASS